MALTYNRARNNIIMSFDELPNGMKFQKDDVNIDVHNNRLTVSDGTKICEDYEGITLSERGDTLPSFVLVSVSLMCSLDVDGRIQR